jgi:hypothetical protein
MNVEIAFASAFQRAVVIVLVAIPASRVVTTWSDLPLAERR